MDTLDFSQRLAQRLLMAIDRSGMSKQQVSNISGIPWATFCRRLDHPEKSFLTIPEMISICDAINLNFIEVLTEVEEASAIAEGGE